jgi:hypothetical protein
LKVDEKLIYFKTILKNNDNVTLISVIFVLIDINNLIYYTKVLTVLSGGHKENASQDYGWSSSPR